MKSFLLLSRALTNTQALCHRPCWLLLLLSFLSLSTNAQINFQPGIVVMQSGDTLHGLINHKEWQRNPDIFSFKKSLNDPTIELNDISARYFAVGGESYVQYEGIISMDINTTRRADI